VIYDAIGCACVPHLVVSANGREVGTMRAFWVAFGGVLFSHPSSFWAGGGFMVRSLRCWGERSKVVAGSQEETGGVGVEGGEGER